MGVLVLFLLAFVALVAFCIIVRRAPHGDVLQAQLVTASEIREAVRSPWGICSQQLAAEASQP
jgi:uncharacterized protein YcfJ